MAELKQHITKNGVYNTTHLSKRKGSGLTSKCASLVKEQRARIYILRRCATMLCCWYIQGDD